MTTKKPAYLHAVLFPVLTAAFMMGATELGANGVLLVLSSPLLVAYPFLWAWDFVYGGGR